VFVFLNRGHGDPYSTNGEENYMSMKLKALLASALAVTLVGTASHAALLAYEGFNYSEATGTSIAGLNGGTGFGEAWPTPNNANLTLTDGLTIPGDLVTAGKGLRYGANANVSDGRAYNGGGALANGEYWYSFLVKPGVGGRGTLMPFRSSTSGDGQNGWGLRIDSDSNGMRAWSPTQAAGAPIPFTVDTVYLVVGRLTVGDIALGNPSTTAPGGSNSIWVLTSTPLDEASLGPAMSTIGQHNTTGTFSLSGRAFSNNTSLVYDEIRIGTTFSSVVPVIPEPASLAFVGGFAAVSLLRRR
jgi:hypothetical protein